MSHGPQSQASLAALSDTRPLAEALPDDLAAAPEAARAQILAYRIQRKRLWHTVLDVLAAHEEVHSVSEIDQSSRD